MFQSYLINLYYLELSNFSHPQTSKVSNILRVLFLSLKSTSSNPVKL